MARPEFVWVRTKCELEDGTRVEFTPDGVVDVGPLKGKTVTVRSGYMFELERGSEVRRIGRVFRRVQVGPSVLVGTPRET